MAFHRCFSSLGCPELSLDDTLALAAKHGVDAVELRAIGGTVELPQYFAQHYGSPAALAARVARQRVRVVALDASLRLAGATAAEREQLAALAPWADALGVRRLRVFDGKQDSDRELAEAVETLRWWRALRRERGWRVDVMVETHDSLVTAAATARFLAAAPGTAILWDSHHTWRRGGEDPAATWRAIRGSVAHLHVKDSISVPGARHPFSYVLPGEGEFPMVKLMDALRADPFSGPVSLEWERLWHPYLPSLDEALRVAAERKWW